MGGKDSKLMGELSKVRTLMEDTVSCVQRNVNILAGVHGMKEALNQVARVHDQLDKEEREALKVMISANSQVCLAAHFARVVVRTCKSIAETVLRVITTKKGKISDKLKRAIHVFVQRVKELMPQLAKARDELAQSQVLLEKAIVGCEFLKVWCFQNISEMKGKAESEVVKQRERVYRGAVVGMAVGIVFNWWNPDGWVASVVVIGGVAGGVVAEFTKGKKVGDLRKEYGRGIESLNETIKLFEDVSKNIEENVCELDKKKKQMKDMAQKSALSGELSITIDEDDVEMFNIFKEDVFKLDKLCHDYLNA